MSISEFVGTLYKDAGFRVQMLTHTFIPPVQPEYKNLVLPDRVKDVLKDSGIERFYTHQADAIQLIRQGAHIVVMTPTASGKSLIYNIPVLESIISDPEIKALYIFPLKGLEQDQVRNFNELFTDIKGEYPGSSKSESQLVSYDPVNKPGRGAGGRKLIINPAEVYDGDTSGYRRKKIREKVPHVIFTNPDMLHLAINPFHRKWETFFKKLRFVILDEIHAYRGILGSNVAHIMRRLRRICNYWGSNPQFITASATIANPDNFAEELIGVPFEVVRDSGAPQGGKHFIFINPIESPYTETTRLFIKCLKEGMRTIVFTKARKITELIYTWTINQAPELEDKVSPYRAGFLPKERREIEKQLFDGELLGVISTSALELGVDIGGLDCCILCGYPGSIASTWQRAGRVGRHGQESMVALIAINDALDQYFMHNPKAFFDKSHEAAVIDSNNINIMKKHIPCASSEVYLRRDDVVYNMQDLMPLIDELVKEGRLAPGKKGDIWFSLMRLPQREVSIRGVGTSFNIVHESGKIIGDVSGTRVFREAFPGAIYLHRGRQYEIIELDMVMKKALCREVDVLYYTQALSREDTEVIQTVETRKQGSFSVRWGSVKTTQKIIGYEKKRIFDRVRISRNDLEMPEYIFETEGLWIIIDKETESQIKAKGFDLAGTLHAVEHAAIACIPLFSLCDRGDIGGLSYTLYPAFKKPAIFIYDGFEGGIGLTKRVIEVIGTWLKATLMIIEDCPCKDGCPSCVQDPQCGSANQPLDKDGAKELIKKWLSQC